MSKSFNEILSSTRGRVGFAITVIALGLVLIGTTQQCRADMSVRGGAALDQDAASMVGIWLTQDGCRDCLAINGGVIRGGDEQGNLFAGVDWSRAVFDDGTSRLRGALGLAYFEKPLHRVGQQFNFHLGIGWEFARHAGVYIDHWSNGRKFFNHRMTEIQNPPRNMISVGVRF